MTPEQEDGIIRSVERGESVLIMGVPYIPADPLMALASEWEGNADEKWAHELRAAIDKQLEPLRYRP